MNKVSNGRPGSIEDISFSNSYDEQIFHSQGGGKGVQRSQVFRMCMLNVISSAVSSPKGGVKPHVSEEASDEHT